MADITLEQKALVVALELLRNQVQENALALAANTLRTEELTAAYAAHVEQFVKSRAPSGPGEPIPTATPVATPVIPTATPVARVVQTAEQRQQQRERREERQRADSWRRTGDTLKQSVSPFAQMGALVGAKFAALVGPLAILGQALNSTTSGLGTLGKASQLVAAVLAPVILPAALMLATSFTAVAELMGENGGAMQSFFETMIDVLLPAIINSIDAFILMAEVAKGTAAVLKELGNAAAFWSAALHGRGTRDARSRVDSSMRDVLESFRRSIGPKAQISGLAEVGKQAQLAALNADPLEMRLMRMQLATLERIAAAVERRRTLDRDPRVHDPLTRAGRGLRTLLDPLGLVL